MATPSPKLSARVGRDSLWMAIARAYHLLGTVAVAALVSRSFGEDGYGVFAAVSIFSALGAVLHIGLPMAMIREVTAALSGGERDRALQFVGSGQAAALLAGVVGCGALALCAPWLAGFADAGPDLAAEVAVAVRVAAWALFCVAAGAGSEALLQGTHRFRTLAVRNVAANTIGWVVLGLALHLGAGLRGALLSALVAPTLTLVLNVAAVRAAGLPAFALGHARGSGARGLVRFALPLLVTEGASLVHLRADALLVLLWLPTHMVGLYHAAGQIAVSALVPPRLLVSAFFPAVAELSAREEGERIRQGVRRAVGYVALAVAPLVAGGIALGAPLLGVVFTGEFRDASTAMALLLLGYGANALTFPFSAALTGMGRPGQVAANTVPTAIAVLGLHVALIPALGIDGAAVGSAAPAVASLCAYPLQTAAALRRVGVQCGVASLVPCGALVRVAAAAGLMAGALLVVPAPSDLAGLLLRVVGGAAVYAVAFAFVLRGISAEDRELIAHLTGRSS